jgi:hypothetical protein
MISVIGYSSPGDQGHSPNHPFQKTPTKLLQSRGHSGALKRGVDPTSRGHGSLGELLWQSLVNWVSLTLIGSAKIPLIELGVSDSSWDCKATLNRCTRPVICYFSCCKLLTYWSPELQSKNQQNYSSPSNVKLLSWIRCTSIFT